MSRVPCACDCEVVCVFAGSKVMSICKFYSIMTCLIAMYLQLQGVCVFAGSTVLSICKFYSIMTCLIATVRWSVSLLGAKSCQFVSSTQSWHVWVPSACNCKVVCVFAGCTAMSICKFYSIMTMSECPVPAIARWSVSLLGAKSCQFVSSTQSWHVWVPCACNCKVVCVFAGSTVISICKFYSIMTCLSALCLQLQGGLCLCWEQSHVNL